MDKHNNGVVGKILESKTWRFSLDLMAVLGLAISLLAYFHASTVDTATYFPSFGINVLPLNVEMRSGALEIVNTSLHPFTVSRFFLDDRVNPKNTRDFLVVPNQKYMLGSPYVLSITHEAIFEIKDSFGETHCFRMFIAPLEFPSDGNTHIIFNKSNLKINCAEAIPLFKDDQGIHANPAIKIPI
jgi:hypothetical protein